MPVRHAQFPASAPVWRCAFIFQPDDSLYGVNLPLTGRI
jgi:hypothetical protein